MLVRSNNGTVYDVGSKYIDGRNEVPASRIIKTKELPTEQELADFKAMMKNQPPKKTLSHDVLKFVLNQEAKEKRLAEGRKLFEQKIKTPSIEFSEEQQRNLNEFIEHTIEQFKKTENGSLKKVKQIFTDVNVEKITKYPKMFKG